MAARKGDTLRVHYTGTLSDGREFDSSRGREPLEFVLGQEMLIPGFERAVEGKAVGETVSVLISPDDAYGPRNEGLILAVPRGDVPAHITPEVGLRLQITMDDGEMEVVITKVTEKEVVLDGNHPLAGESLLFHIEIVDIKTG
jgi:peptidylprolyl isomerase